MARNRINARTGTEVCSDCSAADPSWASINRGVLICSDCASIHRSLGRHISQVKHLQKCKWHPNTLSMVQHLVAASANSIWEHSLLDPTQMRSGKRKPNPSDHVHPTKSEFIKSKYLNLSFVHRLAIREEDQMITDISKQLHSSVRTGNLETSLRLLSSGAQPNYFNAEKGNTSLHVAAKAGQALQVELLMTYGADPLALDSNNKTAEELARADNHVDLAERLVDLQYELSDRLSYFVSGQMPDHKAGKHFLVPKPQEYKMASTGKKRLQKLNDMTFEELAMDVYDEVDRRELEVVWQESQKNILLPNKGSNPAFQYDHQVVPFLPVNPDYSTTRNQGRQKLGIFKDTELNILICDIIGEIVRRTNCGAHLSGSSEDPVYDLPPDGDVECMSGDSSTSQPTMVKDSLTISKEEFLSLQQQLSEREAECTKLQELNRDLSHKVTSLAKQNHELNKKVQDVPLSHTLPSIPKKPDFFKNSPHVPGSPSGRPFSVFNPNESIENQIMNSEDDKENRRRTIHVETPTAISAEEISDRASNRERLEKAVVQGASHSSTGSDYDNHGSQKKEKDSENKEEAGKLPTSPEQKSDQVKEENSNSNNNQPPQPAVETANEPAAEDSQTEASRSESSSPQFEATEEEVIWPEHSALMKKTELLTKNIQTLLQTAQIKKTENYLDCAENILSAVSDVVALFDKPYLPSIKSVLQSICGSAHKLRNRCKETADQKSKPEHHKQLTENIISYAYEIAIAEKQLVMMAPKEDAEASSSS